MTQDSLTRTSEFRRRLRAGGALAILGLTLAGCGGGDGVNSVSAAPGPVEPLVDGTEMTFETVVGEPLDPTPALTTGNYDTIALVLNERQAPMLLTPGQIQVDVDSATNSYSFTLDPAVVPQLANAYGEDLSDGRIKFQIYSDTYGHEYDQITRENGLVTDEEHYADREAELYGYIFDDPVFTTKIGKSHVSLGQWSWPYTTTNAQGQTVTGDWVAGSAIYVYGDRTPAGEIPVSGSATYRVDSGADVVTAGPRDSNSFGPDKLDIALNADFGARSIGATVQYEVSSYDGDAYHEDLSGSAPIASSGNFDIALTGSRQAGTLESGSFLAGPDAATASAGGQMAGAFFGPAADQVGGTMYIPGFLEGEMLGIGFVATKP